MRDGGSSPRLAALVIAGIAGVYLVLAGIVLNPRTFFSGDAGVKYLQAESLVQARWQRLAVRNPAASIDPEERFSVLATNQFRRRAAPGAPFYGSYSELFSVPVSLCLALLGMRGLYAVPILAGIATMVLAYRLSARTAPRTAWLAPMLVGACSPMLFYSVDLWEHTLATALVAVSVLLFVSGTSAHARWRFLLAGLTLGAAVAMREELYGMLPAGLTALAWVDRRHRRSAALAAAAGVLAVLLPHWMLKWTEIGVPARLSVLRLVGLASLSEPVGPEQVSRLPAIGLIAPTSAAWWLPLAAAALARAWLPRAAPRWCGPVLLALAAAVAIWACADALVLSRTWTRPDDLVRAFPAVLFLLFLPGASAWPSPARREIGALLTIAAVFATGLCIAAPFVTNAAVIGGAQWGPRFLLPLAPLLAAAIVFALEHRRAWASTAGAPGGLMVAVFAVLALASLAVQLQGVRDLRAAKAQYERLVATTQALDDGGVIVTDLWWFPAVTAAVLDEQTMLSVDRSGNGSLPELLARLEQRGITSLTLVTPGDAPARAHADALAEAGWTTTAHRVVPIWLDVGFFSYRRDPPGNAGPAPTLEGGAPPSTGNGWFVGFSVELSASRRTDSVSRLTHRSTAAGMVAAPSQPAGMMTNYRRSVIGALATLAAWVGPVIAADPPRRLKACVVSLNEPQELEAFRAHLDPRQFELVDLRAAASSERPPDSAGSPGASASWLLDACTPETTCDLMVYSAEFAGRFFGKQGVSLSLQELEEASCQARCSGLFRRPMEVFLLACNTLATKDEDDRTPEEYLRVLLEHGFDRPAAERVVELRYGPLGPSFRESLRRVFAGVPRIYGFSSVAPRGELTAPMLARYLRGQPDYARALRRQAGDTRPNKALFNSFKGTSFTQAVGLTAVEAGASDRADICALYDEARPVVDRLAIAHSFLSRPDALTFVPTLEVFVSRHPPESLSPPERALFTEIQRLDAARDTLLDLVRSLNVSALKLELAHFAVLVGWLSQAEFHALAVDGARELFRQLARQPLTAEVVDIMCEITKRESLRADFAIDDIPPLLYLDPDGYRLLACLAPSDPRLPPKIIRGLESADPYIRMWSAYAVAQLLPLDETVLERLVPYLRDPSPEIASRMRWVFEAHGTLPKRVVQAMAEAESEPAG